MSEIIKSIEKAQLRTDRPDFNVGDTLRVFVKVVEGNRERLQAFEGTVIARRNGSCRETFTVRRVSYGIGVERTFPLHSPRVDHIEIIRRGKVRRAKLYYLRGLQGKAAKIKDEVEIAIQVNGKIKGLIMVPASLTREQGDTLREHEAVKAAVGDKQIVKFIFVPGRLLNIVVK